MPRVVFLLVPQLHLLDLAGPAQVFSTAASFGHPYELRYVAEQPDVMTAQGIAFLAGLDWPELEPDDLVVVPGWRASTLAHSGPLSEASVRRLSDHHARGGMVASVCAGADALGRAGLLDGRRCTTHHDVQDELARRYPLAKVVRDVLYVVDGRVVTSAGIASGIDLALHLVATRHGPGAAARVAREMVVYARRKGDEPQASAMLRHRSHLSDTVHELTGVSCATRASCIAVGDDTTSKEFSTLRPLAQAWNGTSWRVLATPSSVRFGQLASVACTGRLSCMAVGGYLNGNGQPVRPLTEAWNGGRWQVRTTPGLGPATSGQLAALSCTRASTCRAVGGVVSRAADHVGLAEAWNGASWRMLRITSPDPQFSALYAISCTSASRCVAAGVTGTQLTLAEQWNGATWRRLPTPSP